jgi:hypothetical protein
MKILIFSILCLFCAQNGFSQTNVEVPIVETSDVDSTSLVEKNKNQSVPTPAPTKQSSAVTNETAQHVGDQEEAIPYPQEHRVEKVKKTHLSGPPKHYGDCTGPYWIGQRVVTLRHAGWGWLKHEGENWRTAKWIMLKEEPGKIQAPHRFYDSASSDDNMQYRIYGDFATYKGYEPNVDTLVDVFILKGFEGIGLGEKIQRSPPGPSGSGAGRISEREPIKLRGS